MKEPSDTLPLDATASQAQLLSLIHISEPTRQYS